MDEEREEGEVRKEDFKKQVFQPAQVAQNGGYRDCYTASLPPSRKKRLPKRDIRTLNYAFGEPKTDQAAKETQEWLDSLSIAEEEENNPSRKIFPPGLKYRTGSANQSPQVFDRLHTFQENKEPDDLPKNTIKSAQRNRSSEIHAGLQEEDNCNRHINVRKGRRSAVGNNSSSVYAILHPQVELGFKRKKKPNTRRNYLKDHISAIAEMSSMTNMYKENERSREPECWETVKRRIGTESPKRQGKRKHRRATDFVVKNMEKIAEQSAYVRNFRQESRPDVLTPRNDYMGRRIKKELAKEAQLRAIEKAAKSYPPGRRLLSEISKGHILQKLENKHKELIHALKSFPLIYDTPRQIQLKSDIEQQLRNIETSYSYYNNPKVFTSCLDTSCKICWSQHMDSHFSQESLRTTASHDDHLWNHVACAAGIQWSPRNRAKASTDFNSEGIKMNICRTHRAISQTKKRRNQEDEVHISPSKRPNTSSHKLCHQIHHSTPSPKMYCTKCCTLSF